MSIALELLDPLLAGNASNGDYTAPFAPTWRRSIGEHGFNLGTIDLTRKELTRNEMDELFTYGLTKELREVGSCQQTWQGFLAKMTYQRDGNILTQDITPMANAKRALFTRIFDNLLPNGSAESGPWEAYSLATVTQSTEWHCDGDYSCKIVVPDSAGIHGAYIARGIPIVAGVAYNLSGKLHCLSGDWKLNINLESSGAVLGTYLTNGAGGDLTIQVPIDATNAFSGTINIALMSNHAHTPGTIYGDAMVFNQAEQTNSDTGWKIDPDSVRAYSRKEDCLLLEGMSNESAVAKVETELLDSAWPQPTPPSSGRTALASADPDQDRLSLIFSGYWATLNWLYVREAITAAANVQVGTLVDQQSAYIARGIIADNPTLYSIDLRAPLRVGDELTKIARAGESGGAKWAIGVYADRKLNYELVKNELVYAYRDGQLHSITNGEIEPWLAGPGWALWQDLPISPGAISGRVQQDPRWRYVEEIEMQSDYTLQFKMTA